MNHMLSVEDTKIMLNCFDEIQDTAYFILRNSGVFITPQIDGITARNIKCTVENGIIHNDELITELKRRGFDINLFGKINDQYYCENPIM